MGYRMYIFYDFYFLVWYSDLLIYSKNKDNFHNEKCLSINNILNNQKQRINELLNEVEKIKR